MCAYSDSHERGSRVVTERLQQTVIRCDCGFEDRILRGEWRAHVETGSRSGRVRYLLTCPDCASVSVVELNL